MNTATPTTEDNNNKHVEEVSIEDAVTANDSMKTDETTPTSFWCTSADCSQFASDYWRELKRYDVLIALLTAWGLFSLPDKRFQVRRRVRFLALVSDVFLAISINLLLSCSDEEVATTAVGIILTTIFVTIPMEIFNLLWFRWSYTGSTFRRKSAKAKEEGKVMKSCFIWTKQITGVGLGIVWGTALLIFSVIMFAITIDGSRYCSDRHRDVLIGNIIIYQFLVSPVLMALPYWREQGQWLALVGQLGPVLGLILHVREFGFHARPQDEEEEETEATPPAAASDEEANLAKLEEANPANLEDIYLDSQPVPELEMVGQQDRETQP